MRMHWTTLPLALGFIGAAVAAVAQEREPKPQAAEAPFRVVTRDGTQRVGVLTFRWTGFAVDEQKPANDEDADPARPEAPAPGGGDGRGGGGGGRGGGGGGFGGAIGEVLTQSNQLSELDRVEQSEKLLFQAAPAEFTSKLVTQAGYSGGYGKVAFPLPPAGEWRFVEADATHAIAVRRDESGDVIGRLRFFVCRGGDGTSVKRTLAADDAKPNRVFRAVDRRRFASVEKTDETTETLVTGAAVHRVARVGVESLTKQPLHLEVDVPTEAPFFPALEILARGPKLAEIVEQGRWVVESLTFDREHPVDAEAEAPEAPSVWQQIRDLDQHVPSPLLAKGKYANPDLGVEVKVVPPEGWLYFRADADGFMLLRKAQMGKGGFDYAAGALGALRGKPVAAAVKDPSLWVAERYAAGLGAQLGDESPPKLVKGKLGKYATREFALETSPNKGKGGPGSGALTSQALWVIDDSNRIVVVVGIAIGNGTMPGDHVSEFEKWAKNVALTRPR